MLRRVSFLVLYVLLWFVFANDVESLSTLRDQCLEFDIADLEGYVSTLNLASVPTLDTMFAGFECPATALPFGFLRSDWARLLLLRKMITEESTFAQKFERLIGILIIAYQKIERGLVPKGYFNETSNGNSMTTERVVSNTTMVSRNVGIVDVSDEVINKEEKDDVRKDEFEGNKIESFSTFRLNKLSEHEDVKVTTNSMDENWDVNILNEEENERDPSTTFRTSSTPINLEVASVVNSRSTVKLNRFETSTEKFNSIDSLSTVRMGISEEVVPEEEEETERSTGRTINFHDSDDGGNRNIEGDRDFAFTTLPVGSSVDAEASANGSTDFNSFDSDRKKIKNDEAFKVLPSIVDTVTILPEKSEKFRVTFSTSTFAESSTTSIINSHDLREKLTNNESSEASYTNTTLSTRNISSVNFTESVNTDGNVKVNLDRGFAASTKASTESDTTRSTVNDARNRQDLKETIANEVSILEKDNPDGMSRNSMDYLDPSWTNIRDVISDEWDEFDMDESKRTIGSKLKKLSVFRKQPPGTIIINDYPSKEIISPINSIERANGFKKTSLSSRKRDGSDINMENNLRFFYNLGGRSTAREEVREELDFIGIKCKDENA